MIRQGLEPVKRVAYFTYDFAKDGGAIGTIALRGDRLPAGAIVRNGVVHVNTAVTSDGTTGVALHINGAGDVLASTVKGSLTLNAIIDVVPVDTAATSLLIATQGKGVTMTIITTALTAGKITVALEYLG